MRRIRASASLALGALLLSACGFIGGNVDPINLDNGTNAGLVSCGKIIDVSNEISKIDAMPDADPKRADALVAWNVDPDKVAETKAALNDREDECQGESPAPSSSTSAPEIIGTGTPVEGDCPAEFVQKFDPNEKGNFSSDGIKGSNDVITLMGHDARYLAFVGHLVRPSAVKNDARPYLEKGGNDCLSQEGRETFYLVKGTLTADSVKINNDAKAPKDSYNTAMQDNRGVVDPKRGVGGNRDAVRFTFANGNNLDVLKRCGNPALKGPGSLPKGPTDHQRPPTKTPSPSTTPPGGTSSSPPPGVDESKKPREAPGNGGPGDGGSSQYGGNGSDRHTADPNPKPPAAGKPDDDYSSPAPPKDDKPPAGSKPTQTPPPPSPEPSANPTDGGGNEGDPGGW